jgi:hypothetical protein
MGSRCCISQMLYRVLTRLNTEPIAQCLIVPEAIDSSSQFPLGNGV